MGACWSALVFALLLSVFLPWSLLLFVLAGWLAPVSLSCLVRVPRGFPCGLVRHFVTSVAVLVSACGFYLKPETFNISCAVMSVLVLLCCVFRFVVSGVFVSVVSCFCSVMSVFGFGFCFWFLL